MVAFVDFKLADLENGVTLDAIEIQSGAVLLGGYVEILKALNSETSDSIAVGDSDSPAEYGSANGADIGVTALVPTGKEYPVINNVTLTWTGVGIAPTAGEGRLVVEYMATGRAQFSQG